MKATSSLRYTNKPLRSFLSAQPRTISSFLHLRQPYAQQVRRRDEEIEDEIEDEVDSQQIPSGSNIDATAQYGPATKFAELAERNLVSEKIVRTLTEDMGLVTMTQVQSLTINETLKGVDT